MMQRKNKPKATPSVTADTTTTANIITSEDTNTTTTSSHNNGLEPLIDKKSSASSSQSSLHYRPKQQNSKDHVPILATVRRRKFGTQPFDEHWLNLDCCGIFCACLTYALHFYGCYAVCFILIPPWMSYEEEEGGERKMSLWGKFHCLAFTAIAIMAIVSHLRAMMTDPGAVPPDAVPLPDPNAIQNNNTTDENSLEMDRNASPTSVPSGNAEATTSLMEKDNSSSNNGLNRTNSAVAAAAVVAAGAATVATGGVAVAAGAAATAAAAAVPPSSAVPAQHPNVQTAARGKRICRRCNAFKPRRAHHCSICKRCIIKMDHHCPWVNNCVGIGNHKFFLLFIFYTCLSCGYSMTLVMARFFNCVGSHGRHGRGAPHCLDEPVHLLNIVGLVVEALLFGLFTCCMMVDQWDVVMTNVTHIDRLKGEMGFGNQVVDTGINEVFGTGQGRRNNYSSCFRADWLSPLHRVCFPASVKDEIMGFCRPCGLGGGAENDVEMPDRNVRRVAEIV